MHISGQISEYVTSFNRFLEHVTFQSGDIEDLSGYLFDRMIGGVYIRDTLAFVHHFNLLDFDATLTQ